MLGSDASTKANFVLRDGRVINGRNPKTAATQLVTEAIHSFAVSDHDRHDVSSRCTGIDSKLAKFLMKIIRVLPKFSPQGRTVSDRNFQSFEQSGNDSRRQSA